MIVHLYQLCSLVLHRYQRMFPNLAKYIEHVVVEFCDVDNQNIG